MASKTLKHMTVETWADYYFNPFQCLFNGTPVVQPDRMWALAHKYNTLEAHAPRRGRVMCADIDIYGHDDDCPYGPDCHPLSMVGGQPTVSLHEEELFAWGARPATAADVRRRFYRLIQSTPNLYWLILTRNPDKITGDVPIDWLTPGTNVGFGVEVRTQADAEELPFRLLKIPFGHRFIVVNMEEPVRFGADALKPIDDLFLAPASGVPLRSQWVRDVRDECREHNVAFFFDGWDKYVPLSQVGGEVKPHYPIVTMNFLSRHDTTFGGRTMESDMFWQQPDDVADEFLIDGKSHRDVAVIERVKPGE